MLLQQFYFTGNNKTYSGLHERHLTILPNFNKILVFLTISIKVLNIDFHGTPSSGSRTEPHRHITGYFKGVLFMTMITHLENRICSMQEIFSSDLCLQLGCTQCDLVLARLTSEGCNSLAFLRLPIHYFNTNSNSTVSVVMHPSTKHAK